ncbi:MAG: endolytic transglycosylase MltG [Saprospiraceae bacterium]
MRKKYWIILAVLGIVLIGLGIFGYQKYKDFLLPNVPENLSEKFIHIPTGSTFEEVVFLMDSLNMLLDTQSFRNAAARMNYIKPSMRSGRYEIKAGWSNLDLIRHLRGGAQAPVMVVLNNERLLEEVAVKVSGFIEADSSNLLNLFFNKDYLDSIGYASETLMSLFIPNSYEFFWNTSARGFMSRMIKEHDAFWSKNNRKEKAANLGLNPEEVYTLASIVERESNKNQERPTIAGVYLNRLKINMILQADPTLVFATRDFTAKRVLNFHKEFDSPYNTYMYAGLPPVQSVWHPFQVLMLF